jgi:hypothetical protein
MNSTVWLDCSTRTARADPHGKVTGLCKPRHRLQEFLVFLKEV